MKKPKKADIISGIQFGLMMYFSIVGFWHTYSWVFWKIGLLSEWWALLITMVLAILSQFGLVTWVCNKPLEG